MKTLFKLLLFIPVAFLTSCSNDDDTVLVDNPFGDTKIYQLASVADPSISGTATFTENTNGSTTVELQLSGTPSGGMHPAHIHFNTAAETGAIAITLETVNGDTGYSSTNVTALNEDQGGALITYDELLGFDGYINVHLSADDLGTLVAQGDIGQNELTGTSIVYDLATADVPGINGTATFSERVNGEALATIALDGTFDTDTHPGHIHMNTATETGAIAFTFNPVDGATGMSKTNVSALDDNTSFGYTNILDYDGYINIHLSADDLDVLVAQGDIGQNDLTGNSIAYDLATVDVPGITGTATFFERNNGEALAQLSLIGTPNGGMHPAHIHMGSVATAPGDILFTFTPVDGLTGKSETNVSALDDDSPFGYGDVLTVDGYLNVHLSADDLGTLVAQGNIGANL
ncbi:CHRD domain-containing protein [Psychroserpens mesophilus]|uniref:CHRD domain-containing protein n=1 Tax=Psychroserpens mesophilus TaxID=325473 RepID=UPI003D66092B